jgi:hypothetical protein
MIAGDTDADDTTHIWLKTREIMEYFQKKINDAGDTTHLHI